MHNVIIEKENISPVSQGFKRLRKCGTKTLIHLHPVSGALPGVTTIYIIHGVILA